MKRKENVAKVEDVEDIEDVEKVEMKRCRVYGKCRMLFCRMLNKIIMLVINNSDKKPLPRRDMEGVKTSQHGRKGVKEN